MVASFRHVDVIHNSIHKSYALSVIPFWKSDHTSSIRLTLNNSIPIKYFTNSGKSTSVKFSASISFTIFFDVCTEIQIDQARVARAKVFALQSSY